VLLPFSLLWDVGHSMQVVESTSLWDLMQDVLSLQFDMIAQYWFLSKQLIQIFFPSYILGKWKTLYFTPSFIFENKASLMMF
jgi:hypothetical protein